MTTIVDWRNYEMLDFAMSRGGVQSINISEVDKEHQSFLSSDMSVTAAICSKSKYYNYNSVVRPPMFLCLIDPLSNFFSAWLLLRMSDREPIPTIGVAGAAGRLRYVPKYEHWSARVLCLVPARHFFIFVCVPCLSCLFYLFSFLSTTVLMVHAS